MNTFPGKYSGPGFLLVGLFMVFMLQCGGLVKLNIPEEAYENATDNWLMPAKNILRHNIVEEDVLPPYRIQWKRKYKSVITDQPLAVGKYLLFTVENGMLAFIDSETGQLLGDGRLAPGFKHSPALSDNVLYYSANLGRKTLGAFELNDKKLRWSVKLPHLNTSPLVWRNRIFVGANSGKFFAIEKSNGEKVWAFDAKSAIFGNPSGYRNRLFFANVSGDFFCLNAATGKRIWKQKLPANFYAGPVIANNLALIGNTAGTLFGLNLETGETAWSLDTRGSIYGNAAYRDGVVYVGNNAHKMLAVNVADGSVLWEYLTKGINNSAPVVGPDFLYFGSWDKNFYVLDRKTGKLIYRQDLDRPVKSSPIIHNNRVFIHTANHRLYCLEHGELAQIEGGKK